MATPYAHDADSVEEMRHRGQSGWPTLDLAFPMPEESAILRGTSSRERSVKANNRGILW